VKIAIDARRIADFGVGTYIRNLVRTLARYDGGSGRHQYLLLERPDTQEILADCLNPRPANFERVTFGASDRSLRNHLQLKFFLEAHGVDLLHMPHTRVPLLVPVKYVVTVHDLADFLPAHPDLGDTLGGGLRFMLGRRALARAARVLAVSNATRSDVVRHFQLDPARVEVVYNAIGEELAQPLGDEEQRRMLERYGVNYPFLLYAGSVKPQKNVVKLIEAFSALRGDLGEIASYDRLKLIVIGDEPSNNPELRRAVIRCRQEDSVRFLGFVPHEVLRAFYSAAEAFVFPSLYEGFGLPPLEAMAQGTPVVVSSVSSLPEVVGDAAILVHPDHVFDIARGIKRVLTEPATRERLVRRGLEQVRRFSWDRSVQQVLNIYEQVGGTR
jgi:glycosyltransferase involved in cell wall biosynthesis